jgi:putative ABC transport system substrate-binding protein
MQFDQLGRREFITLVGNAAAAWPLYARAEQPIRNRKIGFLHPGQAANVDMRIAAIHEGLLRSSERDVNIELLVRLADGELTRLPALARDLVDNRAEAIIAAGPPAVHAASGATTEIPIVAIDLETDPVASGLIESLARPGRNVTGIFLDFPEFSAKCLQILKEAVSGLSTVGVLWDPSTGPVQLASVRDAGRQLQLTLEILETRSVTNLAEAFQSLDTSRVQGVLILSSPLFGGNPQLVADLALRRGVPTISLFPDTAKMGGLLAYGPDIQSLFRQVAGMARRVLLGARAADMPVERPTRFELVANLRAAEQFGLTLPPSVLLRADEVID